MSQKNILLLGAGFVAKPTVEILVRRPENHVTVACRTQSKAEALISGFNKSQVTAIALDVSDQAALESQVAKNDLIISLIPYTFHVKVIEAAIKYEKNVCTTSYVSDGIQALDEKARAANITVMNEIGLDPGIDHLYAISMIDKVHKAGGKIIKFISFCGGLPAPECADNPLGYKFSWSSRGVLLALKNSAKFYEDGDKVEVEGSNLMQSIRPYSDIDGFNFVCYPNRDSTVFKEFYNTPEAETVIRGTLRYSQFPDFISALVGLGFLDESPNKLFTAHSQSWAKTLQSMTNAASESESDLIAAVSKKCNFKSEKHMQTIIDGLKWLDLFSSSVDIEPRGNALDTLCATLEKKMQYGPSERDMIALQHKFYVENKDGSRDNYKSTLVEYGDPAKYSAMSRLVGVPCGIAAQQMLDGTLNRKGVVRPYDMQICQPLIESLESEGIKLIEKKL